MMLFLLKLISLLLLIPGSILIFLSANIYFENKLYTCIKTILALIYSALVAFIFNSFFGLLCFGAIMYLYIKRAHQIRSYRDNRGQTPDKTIAYGKAETHHFLSTQFWLDLSIINLITWLPRRLLNEMSKPLGTNIDLAQLLKDLVQGSKGTKIEIKDNNHTFYFEII